MVLERLLFPAQLPLPLEGGAEVFAVLPTQRRLLLLPSAPAVMPGAGGLRLGSRVDRPLAGPGPSSLSLCTTKRGMGQTCRTVPDPSIGRCPTRRAWRGPLRSLTLRGVDERHDILEPRRSRCAVLCRNRRMPQQELGRLQSLRRSSVFKLQAVTCPRLALLRGGRGRLTAPVLSL